MQVNAGDTAWMLVAAALVMLMTPGLALFYGGMVRAKNVLATFQQSFILLGVVAVQWVLIGYSLAFGPDAFGGLIGGLQHVGLSGVGLEPSADYAKTVPHQLFMVYQLMFAVITPALITGAIADRLRFGAWVTFVAVWSLLVYAPVAHWVFSPEGWLFKRGALDFAGGSSAHEPAGHASPIAPRTPTAARALQPFIRLLITG